MEEKEEVVYEGERFRGKRMEKAGRKKENECSGGNRMWEEEETGEGGGGG